MACKVLEVEVNAPLCVSELAGPGLSQECFQVNRSHTFAMVSVLADCFILSSASTSCGGTAIPYLS